LPSSEPSGEFDDVTGDGSVDPSETTTWKFYVGASLHSTNIEPYVVEIGLDVEGWLSAGDPEVWAFILSAIERTRAAE
jgi:hypothetical protein